MSKMVEIRKDAMYSDCLNQPCSIIKKKVSSCILVVQINYNKTKKVISSQMMLISQLFWQRILANSSLSSWRTNGTLSFSPMKRLFETSIQKLEYISLATPSPRQTSSFSRASINTHSITVPMEI